MFVFCLPSNLPTLPAATLPFCPSVLFSVLLSVYMSHLCLSSSLPTLSVTTTTSMSAYLLHVCLFSVFLPACLHSCPQPNLSVPCLSGIMRFCLCVCWSVRFLSFFSLPTLPVTNSAFLHISLIYCLPSTYSSASQLVCPFSVFLSACLPCLSPLPPAFLPICLSARLPTSLSVHFLSSFKPVYPACPQ